MLEDLEVQITDQGDLFYILQISIQEIIEKMLKTLVSIEIHSLPWLITLHKPELKCLTNLKIDKMYKKSKLFKQIKFIFSNLIKKLLHFTMLTKKENKEKFLILILIFLLDFVRFRQMMEEYLSLVELKTLLSQAIMHMNSEMVH